MRTKTEARGVGEGWVDSGHVWTQENAEVLHGISSPLVIPDDDWQGDLAVIFAHGTLQTVTPG
ncbi:hypothetical protein [Streptomyces lydicus]|uniref:hypothetical protein n=1 Tax=Streptomyces lydicus TaxID=47763 RepID=UPI00371589F7